MKKREFHTIKGLTTAQMVDVAYEGVATLARDIENLTWETREEFMATKYAERAVEVAEQIVAEQKATARREKSERKLQNRGGYVPTIDVEITARPSGTVKMGFKHGLDNPGLMERVLRQKGVDSAAPVVLNMLNKLPKDADGQQYELPHAEVQNFRKFGYMVSGGKTLWNFNIPELKALFTTAFPTAIDFASYNRRFRAPLVSGGFLPGVQVLVKNISVGGVRQEVDGSGLYDPEHQDMKDLVERYGAIAFQLTAVHDCGTVFKGVICPRRGINEGEPTAAAIHFDHLQVKGGKKAAHKAAAKLDGDQTQVLDGVYIGIMKSKVDEGRVSNCFQTLEQIEAKTVEDRSVIADIVEAKVNEAIDKIGKIGPSGLLGRACSQDQQLRRLAQFIKSANEACPEAQVNPMDVPFLRAKVESSLGRSLWSPANGGGMSGHYPMVVIDTTVQRGTVVIKGIPVGRKLACWRFPTILAQGLLVLEAAEAAEHHMIDNQVIGGVMFMNPFDITTCQQGDDDGDEVGISLDPRVIEMFEHRRGSEIYHIEPVGEKFEHETLSEDGLKYIAGDPMGPVGQLTIMKAKLTAVGSHDWALAFAVGVQEAIDSQKNLVRATDPNRAKDVKNWHRDEQGELHIHYKVDGQYITNNFLTEEAGEFPLELYSTICDQEMVAKNCIRVQKNEDGTKTVKPGWPLGWRTQVEEKEGADGNVVRKKLRKSIAVNNWRYSLDKQNGDAYNWVHYAHDCALERWEKWGESFKSTKPLDAVDLLEKMLANAGHVITAIDMDFGDYVRTLRKSSGLEEYGKAMKRILSDQRLEEQARLSRIDQASAELNLRLSKLSVEEQLSIWRMEMTPTWYYVKKGHVYVHDLEEVREDVRTYPANNVNNAFRAATAEGGQLMELLGLKSEGTCDFLSEKDLGTKTALWALSKPKPYHVFSNFVAANKTHGNAVSDENGERVELEDCKHCMHVLKTSLVREVRSRKSAREIDAVKRLNTAFNQCVHIPIEGLAEQAQVEEDGGAENQSFEG